MSWPASTSTTRSRAFAAFILASPLGIVLSLLSSPAYGFYVGAPNVWGLSDLADQQLAGVTMSVEQAAVFFGVGAFFVLRDRGTEIPVNVRSDMKLA